MKTRLDSARDVGVVFGRFDSPYVSSSMICLACSNAARIWDRCSRNWSSRLPSVRISTPRLTSATGAEFGSSTSLIRLKARVFQASHSGVSEPPLHWVWSIGKVCERERRALRMETLKLFNGAFHLSCLAVLRGEILNLDSGKARVDVMAANQDCSTFQASDQLPLLSSSERGQVRNYQKSRGCKCRHLL